MKIYISLPITGYDLQERKQYAESVKNRLQQIYPGGEIFGIQPELFAYGSDAVKNYYKGNLCYKSEIRNLSKNHNNVHFYVARDKYDNVLCLYLGKPLRGVGTFHPCDEGCAVVVGNYFFNFGLNPKNFENLKFEDEPVEVFLNLEN